MKVLTCKQRDPTSTAAVSTFTASGPCRTLSWRLSMRPGERFARSGGPGRTRPLQALELLNDVTYVEAARGLAQLMLSEGGAMPEVRLSYGFRRATARKPGSAELKVLMHGLERYRRSFRAIEEPRSADPARRKQAVREARPGGVGGVHVGGERDLEPGRDDHERVIVPEATRERGGA